MNGSVPSSNRCSSGEWAGGAACGRVSLGRHARVRRPCMERLHWLSLAQAEQYIMAPHLWPVRQQGPVERGNSEVGGATAPEHLRGARDAG